MSKYKQLTRDEQLIGKTIKDINYDAQCSEMCIIFNDLTFCIIHDCSFNSFSDIEVSDITINLNANENPDELFNFGLIDQNEYELGCISYELQLLKNEKEREEKDQEREYNQYLKLKQKYEG